MEILLGAAAIAVLLALAWFFLAGDREGDMVDADEPPTLDTRGKDR